MCASFNCSDPTKLFLIFYANAGSTELIFIFGHLTFKLK